MPPFFYLPIIVLCAAITWFICCKLVGIAKSLKYKRRDQIRGWRVGHIGRDQMFYEEFRGGVWNRIIIDGELLSGRAHHVIYFPNNAKWREYPEWAQSSRGEIISRIKTAFTPPDYEYHDV